MLQTPCLMAIPESMTDDRAQRVDAAQAIERFLRAVERRALRMAELSTRQREDAIDLVQDAMFGFVRHYGTRDAAEWGPLFWRVLDSRINDWHRRQQVRGRWLGWFGRADEEGADDPVAAVPDPREPGPLARLADGEASQALESALQKLPLRQRQAFLLRLWEGLDVAATATAMRCSEGSVKTHLSRALANLRTRLEDHR
ncbi:RNA polymerase sigma factor [Dokdonella sp.]|uniref:RNA polymerase sigma factor n=1 Tax=Dokdonella sp. TaxID=2291710 RepID=UPI0037842828